MAKKRKNAIPMRHLKINRSPEKQITYLLEQTTPAAIIEAKKYSDGMLDYHWKYYYELAQQREKILDEIKGSLLKYVTEKYEISKWQRAVKWKYSNHPMCILGSRIFVGQRFNYGDEINSQITGFPSLYLAYDKDTALQETLGQSASSQEGLSAKEIALSNSQSETIVSMSGSLDQIIDLRTDKQLKDFVKLIDRFELSAELRAAARDIGDNPGVVTTVDVLRETLLEPNWRDKPVQYQVPSNSQIFGQLVSSCGIHGILYPSKLTGKDCLAIYPQNFKDSECYLVFDDQQPDKRVPNRIDSNNYDVATKDYDEIISQASKA